MIKIMTTVKIERKVEEGRAIRIAAPSTESTSAEGRTEILETEEGKTDRTMIIMRETSMRASEKTEGEERNGEIRTVIRGGATAKTDRKKAREMKTAIGDGIRVKRDRKEEVEGTNTATGSVGIVTTRGKGPRMTRMTRDTGTDRTSIRENDEMKKEKWKKF